MTHSKHTHHWEFNVNLKNLLAASLIALCSLAHADFSGNVIAIVDGDTIDVLLDEKQKVRVRLADIDAPESHQAFGSRSRQHLASLVFRQQVRVVDKGVDKYGRTLGVVFTGQDANVNVEMVHQGMAWAYRYRERASNSAMLPVEAEARSAKRGLWSDQNATPPWEFRRAPSTTAH